MEVLITQLSFLSKTERDTGDFAKMSEFCSWFCLHKDFSKMRLKSFPSNLYCFDTIFSAVFLQIMTITLTHIYLTILNHFSIILEILYVRRKQQPLQDKHRSSN